MKSTKFVTCCYIMSFVAAHDPQQLSTATIAKWVDTHAARARQLVSLLVKAELLKSVRGGAGGVMLNRKPTQITLFDIYVAAGDADASFFHIDNPFSAWSDHCSVHDVLVGVRTDVMKQTRKSLKAVKLSDVFVPWKEVASDR